MGDDKVFVLARIDRNIFYFVRSSSLTGPALMRLDDLLAQQKRRPNYNNNKYPLPKELGNKSPQNNNEWNSKVLTVNLESLASASPTVTLVSSDILIKSSEVKLCYLLCPDTDRGKIRNIGLAHVNQQYDDKYLSTLIND